MAKRNEPLPGPLVLDSSCWLEVFDGGARAAFFEAVAAEPEKLIVPVITLYEVFKYLARVKGVESATRAALYMQRGRVIDLDSPTVLAAAAAASIKGLPMADSLIYATAQAHEAMVWTQDAHFDGLAGVRYFRKP